LHRLLGLDNLGVFGSQVGDNLGQRLLLLLGETKAFFRFHLGTILAVAIATKILDGSRELLNERLLLLLLALRSRRSSSSTALVVVVVVVEVVHRGRHESWRVGEKESKRREEFQNCVLFAREAEARKKREDRSCSGEIEDRSLMSISNAGAALLA
jgi:hypothetical protein